MSHFSWEDYLGRKWSSCVRQWKVDSLDSASVSEYNMYIMSYRLRMIAGAAHATLACDILKHKRPKAFGSGNISKGLLGETRSFAIITELAYRVRRGNTETCTTWWFPFCMQQFSHLFVHLFCVSGKLAEKNHRLRYRMKPHYSARSTGNCSMIWTMKYPNRKYMALMALHVSFTSAWGNVWTYVNSDIPAVSSNFKSSQLQNIGSTSVVYYCSLVIKSWKL